MGKHLTSEEEVTNFGHDRKLIVESSISPSDSFWSYILSHERLTFVCILSFVLFGGIAAFTFIVEDIESILSRFPLLKSLFVLVTLGSPLACMVTLFLIATMFYNRPRKISVTFQNKAAFLSSFNTKLTSLHTDPLDSSPNFSLSSQQEDVLTYKPKSGIQWLQWLRDRKIFNNVKPCISVHLMNNHHAIITVPEAFLKRIYNDVITVMQSLASGC